MADEFFTTSTTWEALSFKSTTSFYNEILSTLKKKWIGEFSSLHLSFSSGKRAGWRHHPWHLCGGGNLSGESPLIKLPLLGFRNQSTVMSIQAAEITAWKLPSEIPPKTSALEVGRRRKCSSQLFPALEESVVKNPNANEGHMRLRFDPSVTKIPWRRKWQPTPKFLPGESHRQRSLAGYSPWGCRESDMTEQLSTGVSLSILSYVQLGSMQGTQRKRASKVLLPITHKRRSL